MKTDDKYDYIIALDITPKEPTESLPPDFVTDLLGLITPKGDPIGNTKLKSDRWYWRFSTPSIDVMNNERSISEYLLDFLKQLPSDSNIWKRLNDHFESEIYFPIERDYFLIEATLDSAVIIELAKRNLTFKLSALFKSEENSPNQSVDPTLTGAF
jgi:ATP-dependent exoDNAse (exonuclease V) beta subunit